MHKLKLLGKATLTKILGRQVRRLRARNPTLKVVAVAGSVGKTSTKLAIAHVLQSKFRVRYQDGNYNDPLSVPLIFFDLKAPSVWNIFAWIIIIIRSELIVRRPYLYDFVVAELGTDKPGDMAKFKSYLLADIGVLTSIAPEHMENFGDIESVAKEELVLGELAPKIFVSANDVCDEYKSKLADTEVCTYGLKKNVDYSAATQKLNEGLVRPVKFDLNGTELIFNLPLVSKDVVKSALVAAAISLEQGVDLGGIKRALEKLPSTPGRMQKLKGIKKSWIIDDTYNSSPVAAISAFNIFSEIDSDSRILIFGSMNELGESSADLHHEVAEAIGKLDIDVVATIGHEAYRHMAKSLSKSFSSHKAPTIIRSFLDPVSAGRFVRDNLQTNSLILVKGSQNGVFAEEALKVLLANKSDSKKLVRQSKSWLRTKSKQFPDVKVK